MLTSHAAPERPRPKPQDAPRKRIKELEVMVSDVVVETPDTVTLFFFTGNDRLDYKAGHFLTIDPHQFGVLERFIAYNEDVKGRRESPRAYSLASSPHEKYLAITVKEERYISGITPYPPLLSPLLVKQMSRGTQMRITGFTGPYTLPLDVESKAEHIVHVCAGSGIVPSYSIIKHALAAHPGLRHTLVYSNKTWNDVIYRQQLRDLEIEHPGRLRVVHTLTRESSAESAGASVRNGRLGAELLRELIPDPSECLVFACGPAISSHEKKKAKQTGIAPRPRFLESALDALESIGVPKKSVTCESYG